MRFAELDAVTVDAHGTMLELRDPVPALRLALAERGVERDGETVRRGFEAEAAYYVERTSHGHDEPSLLRLRAECAAVFLAAVGAELGAAEFAGPYVDALEFRPCDGAIGALRALRARGLGVAVVSNWDVSLGEQLDLLGITSLVDTIVTSAEAGADKPDPAIFRLALERLGVSASRALHVGDGEKDERGAEAAGMRFAWAPLADVAA